MHISQPLHKRIVGDHYIQDHRGLLGSILSTCMGVTIQCKRKNDKKKNAATPAKLQVESRMEQAKELIKE